MVDSGRKTSYKRKELGGSVVGSLLVKSFKTPNQILKDALNEYDGKEAINDIANEPKVIAGRIHNLANAFAQSLKDSNHEVITDKFFGS